MSNLFSKPNRLNDPPPWPWTSCPRRISSPIRTNCIAVRRSPLRWPRPMCRRPLARPLRRFGRAIPVRRCRRRRCRRRRGTATTATTRRAATTVRSRLTRRRICRRRRCRWRLRRSNIAINMHATDKCSRPGNTCRRNELILKNIFWICILLLK